MKNEVRQRKPIPFFLKIGEEMMQKWTLFEVRHGVFEREKWGRQWTITKIQGKNWKTILKLSLKRKTCVFVTDTSHQLVAKVTRQNTSSQKFWKNLLSVFHDWKSHSRGSRELSRENFCVPLSTGPSTREQVSKIDLRALDCGMWLGWPATKSPKQGNTVFEIFQFLWKQNTFQKYLKHSKIFLYLNQQRLSMWKHILSSTITQMNMTFIEHKLVCCVWISTMR